MTKSTRPSSIAIVGEFNDQSPLHHATDAAIVHSCAKLGADVIGVWCATEDVSAETLSKHDGILIAPGSPYRSMENALTAIRYARENRVPCLGTCGGFQHIVIEYARNILGYVDAQHAEVDPNASTLFISQLACSLRGRKMSLSLVPGSMAAEIYGDLEATENYYCNFGVNPDVVELFKQSALRIAASDAEGEIRILELPGHPFFMGTLFVPQARSEPGHPHPVVTAFVMEVIGVKR